MFSWDLLRSVESAVSEAECRALYEAVLRAPEGDVVEIGTYKGRSALALGSALKALPQKLRRDRVVVTIDPLVPFVDESSLLDGSFTVEEVRPASADDLRALFSRCGLGDEIVLLQTTSKDAANTYQYARSCYVGLLFVDGSHKEEDVEADYKYWRHLLHSRCIIAWHDCYPIGDRGGRFDGVRRAIDKLVSKERLEVIGQVGSLLLAQRY